ncbi:YqhR family membrane protein [Bacillus sp. JJ722]|uniref:YqhR family membrane protein n=1 Tax=Bacillus sp. JJ722 TaxID=3122973 RepID=UPI002FFE15FA
MMENELQNGKKSDADLDQNQQEKQLSQTANVALTGFIGGLFWSALGQLAYYFHFTDIGPKVIFMGWVSDKWAKGFLGTVIALLLYGLVSILVAFLYYAFLRKVRSLSATILFGVAIWAIAHFVFVPFSPGMKAITDMDLNTLVTTLCLYILYGVFIGVSVSFDYSERLRQEELGQLEQDVQP